MRCFYKTIFIAIAVLIPASLATANQLPDMMFGQTTLTDPSTGVEYFGGMAGNFAVYNNNTIDNYGFFKDNLLLAGDCQGDLGPTPDPCFTLGNSLVSVNPYTFLSSPGKLLTSRTTVKAGTEEKIVLETPALYFGKNVIVGDSFVGSLDLDNFSFWGRHLAMTNDPNVSQEAFWGIQNYSMNGSARVAVNSEDMRKYTNKLDTLKGEAQNLPDGIIPNLFTMQSSNGTGAADTNEEQKYPDGKIWRLPLGNQTISSDKTYLTKGTVIVRGDLTIANGVDILPQAGETSPLGIIVEGNVTFAGNNKIKAAIFATGNINFGENSNFYGSFVASNFPNLIALKATSFFYNSDIQNNCPPGFRFLEIPLVSETNQ